MEFNRTTEDLDIDKSNEISLSTYNHNNIFIDKFKLFKDKNNFFYRYQKVDVMEEKNIILTPSALNTNRSTIIREVDRPNKLSFEVILLPNGIVIDTRRIKMEPDEYVYSLLFGREIIIQICKIGQTKHVINRELRIQLD